MVVPGHSRSLPTELSAFGRASARLAVRRPGWNLNNHMRPRAVPECCA